MTSDWTRAAKVDQNTLLTDGRVDETAPSNRTRQILIGQSAPWQSPARPCPITVEKYIREELPNLENPLRQDRARVLEELRFLFRIYLTFFVLQKTSEEPCQPK